MSERRNATPARCGEQQGIGETERARGVGEGGRTRRRLWDEFGACIKLQISLFGPVVKDAGNKLPR